MLSLRMMMLLIGVNHAQGCILSDSRVRDSAGNLCPSVFRLRGSALRTRCAIRFRAYPKSQRRARGGASFHYNFNEHFALDSQFTYGPATTSTLGAGGQTTFLAGVRAGQRVQDYGFFLHAREGFVHYYRDNGGQPLFSRNAFPAFDVGGTLENYFGSFPDPWKKNMVFRLEVGALIVPYGRATLTPSSSPPIGSPPPPTGPLGTRVGPVFGLGIGFRF